MKLSFVVFVLLGFAFASSQINSAPKSGPKTVYILKSSGAYNEGSIYNFVDIFKRIENHCDYIGRRLIDGILLFIDDFEDANQDKDMSTLAELYRTTGKSFEEVIPHILDDKLSKVCLDVALECQLFALNLRNNGTMKDVSNFEIRMSSMLNAALEKKNFKN